MLLIIETHAASAWDFQCWVSGNTHLIWVYSTVQRKNCQTSRLGSHGLGHSHRQGSVLHHHFHQTRLAATWTLGSLLCTPFGQALCHLLCWWHTAASLNPTGWAGSEWEVKKANSIMGAKQMKWYEWNPTTPCLVFLSCVQLPLRSISDIPGNPIHTTVYFSSFDCNMCYYMCCTVYTYDNSPSECMSQLCL